jgi:hypothetical protein
MQKPALNVIQFANRITNRFVNRFKAGEPGNGFWQEISPLSANQFANRITNRIVNRFSQVPSQPQAIQQTHQPNKVRNKPE